MTPSLSNVKHFIFFYLFHLSPIITISYDYDVLILGAGMTGISTAHTLFSNGITNIMVIEAQDYIGGRLKTIQFNNYSFSAGASWIEGVCLTFDTNPDLCAYDWATPTEVNPMYTLALKYNLTYTLTQFKKGQMLKYGQNMTSVNTTELQIAWKKWNSAYECMYELRQQMTNNWTEYNSSSDISYFAALTKCGWKQPLSAIEKTIEFIGYTFEISDRAKYSTFLYAEEDTFIDFGSEELYVKDQRGYAGIVLNLANEFLKFDGGDENRIILNSPVTKIEYSVDGVEVRIANGSTFTAKHAVITFSIGVHQSEMVEYVPTLPAWKTDSFLACAMVDYTVIYVQWPYDFWTPYNLNASIFHFSDNRQNYFIWAYNFNHESLFPGSNIWRLDIINDDARIQYQSINDTIFEFLHNKLYHYFDRDIIPEPTEIYFESWRLNKYIQGSYANWPLGFTEEDWIKMGHSVSNNSLLFAGEASSAYMGFVHGAYVDGIKTANAIIACMHGNESGCPEEYLEKNYSSNGKECVNDGQNSREIIFLAMFIIVSAILVLFIILFIGKHFYNSNDGMLMSMKENQSSSHLISIDIDGDEQYQIGRQKDNYSAIGDGGENGNSTQNTDIALTVISN